MFVRLLVCPLTAAALCPHETQSRPGPKAWKLLIDTHMLVLISGMTRTQRPRGSSRPSVNHRSRDRAEVFTERAAVGSRAAQCGACVIARE